MKKLDEENKKDHQTHIHANLYRILFYLFIFFI